MKYAENTASAGLAGGTTKAAPTSTFGGAAGTGSRRPYSVSPGNPNPKNLYDMERYMKKQRTVVKPGDVFDVYEIGVDE